MKIYIITIALLVMTIFSLGSYSQAVDPSPAPVLTASPVPTPLPAGQVAVPEPAAPPQWAQDVISNAQKLPVIGPIVSKILLYLGIISAILTALIACLLTILMALSKAFSLAGLVGVAESITAFKDGKVMYWLKYLSMFNAQKPDPKA